MMIIGCDYHPAFQQIAFVDTETGELQERQLQHREEAEKFYRDHAARGVQVRVGMEASGQARWFERLLAELNIELWIGDASVIHAKRVRKQKTDRQDAQLILKLMLKDDFPFSARGTSCVRTDRLQHLHYLRRWPAGWKSLPRQGASSGMLSFIART
jgi:transposase